MAKPFDGKLTLVGVGGKEWVDVRPREAEAEPFELQRYACAVIEHTPSQVQYTPAAVASYERQIVRAMRTAQRNAPQPRPLVSPLAKTLAALVVCAAVALLLALLPAY